MNIFTNTVNAILKHLHQGVPSSFTPTRWASERNVVHSLWLLLFIAGTASADLKVMIAVDSSDREAMVISVLDIQATLARVAGQPVDAIKSQELGDVMRTTRTGGYDIY